MATLDRPNGSGQRTTLPDIETLLKLKSQGYKHKEIAEMFGASVNSVNSAFFRHRQREGTSPGRGRSPGIPWRLPEYLYGYNFRKLGIHRFLRHNDRANLGLPIGNRHEETMFLVWRRMMDEQNLVVLFDAEIPPDQPDTHPDNWKTYQGHGGFMYVKRDPRDPVGAPGRPLYYTTRDRNGRFRTLEELGEPVEPSADLHGV